jgi:hypothetical protein
MRVQSLQTRSAKMNCFRSEAPLADSINRTTRYDDGFYEDYTGKHPF